MVMVLHKEMAIVRNLAMAIRIQRLHYDWPAAHESRSVYRAKCGGRHKERHEPPHEAKVRVANTLPVQSETRTPSNFAGALLYPPPGGGGGGTPIYFLYRDVPTVRVSFSGSSVLNRVYNFTFSCLKQGRPFKSSSFLPLRSHNFRWFRAPSLKCVKTQSYRYRS